jgi:uncharacterized membrane protein
VNSVLHLVFPVTSATHFLGIVGLCFAWSVVANVIVTIAVRFGFRRGRGPEEL